MSDILNFPDRVKYRVFRDPVDMRCGFKKLTERVTKHLGTPPKDEKTLYIFFNRGVNVSKAIFYAHHARYIIHVQLDTGTFQLPYFDKERNMVDLDPVLAMALMDGLKLYTARNA
jgi:transposase